MLTVISAISNIEDGMIRGESISINAVFNLIKLSFQFSLFPAHINISYNNDYVHITCRKMDGQKTVLMNVRPLTITLENYEHNYN